MTKYTEHPARSEKDQVEFESLLTDSFEERIPFNKVMGIKVHSLNPEKPILKLKMKHELMGNHHRERLHGGAIASILDAVGGLAIMMKISSDRPDYTKEQLAARFNQLGTIDMRVDFLSQGIGEEFFATGLVTRLGGRIASVQMTLTNQDDLLIATGSAAYIVS
ncbi:MAG: thioesterase [Sutterellaceae bacterium]|uniref:thioesterase family protein n=1 Tax=Limnobacter sp. UBA7229 TaxID=1946762 RepID=UPI000C668843|nr:thioesterase family protein [Limnobacter sp. UBA7229]MAG81369.1 thioesterase [Sutterellaceae bacterium]MBT83876.1 thioesterase [Sutterellaceae bacterium]|tara:strand:+ start:149 stop:640 length:492 start_codon:yes stop_codon:yes gene_type:complete